MPFGAVHPNRAATPHRRLWIATPLTRLAMTTSVLVYAGRHMLGSGLAIAVAHAYAEARTAAGTHPLTNINPIEIPLVAYATK